MLPQECEWKQGESAVVKNKGRMLKRASRWSAHNRSVERGKSKPSLKEDDNNLSAQIFGHRAKLSLTGAGLLMEAATVRERKKQPGRGNFESIAQTREQATMPRKGHQT